MSIRNSANPVIRIGISTCLLGELVRFDAGHKKDRFCTDVLGQYFEWVPVCPEVEVGMGVPREPVRLVDTEDNARMVGVKTGEDWTKRMVQYSREKVDRLGGMDLCGYIFKSDSPSCGMERVRVYTASGMPSKKGRGLFAAVFIKAFPLIPVEEEGRLNDARIRENFIERVFSYSRLMALMNSQFSAGELVEFHTRHKYQMLAHSPRHYSALGRLVAENKKYSRQELRKKYSEMFMEGLAVQSTPKKNVNVLHHIAGFLRGKTGEEEKKDLLSVIDDYYNGLVPLIVPVTLIRHHVRHYRIEYILGQTYLDPHPKELMLRNHV